MIRCGSSVWELGDLISTVRAAGMLDAITDTQLAIVL